ncbi:MAG TPA: efflux RND transporter periplasmic adaptor subunit [Vicinamibacterales bacterium]|nr:efflux RND transporter periplasmic adaptor subunit [Vicinamibacterales bacterium]
MSRNRKILIAVIAVIILGGVTGSAWWFRRSTAPTVTVEAIKTRDLEAVVSASGKIQPKRFVNISADTSGRVVNLAVNEGDRVTTGQFLMQIDPRTLRTRVESGQAALQANESALDQARQGVETARAQLANAQQNLTRQEGLWKAQLATREALERAQNDVRIAQSTLAEREKQVNTQQVRLGQDRASLASAQFDLSKVRIESPIDGIITRRNIQEGETAVVGTMNNAGTVLLTVADMSVIQAEVEVDETNIPYVAVGQQAKITIDAIPDHVFKAHVTEIGNSPIQTTGAGAQQQATNFKVVVVLDEAVKDVRPGFTCTADITTATRKNVPAVPIPAVAVRELVYDAKGNIVKQPRATDKRPATPTAVAAELEPGQTRKETEGVFVVRTGKVEFIPIKIGIAGDRYFEVVSGLKPGDEVVTGPYNNVRGMTDGDAVKVDAGPKKTSSRTEPITVWNRG